MNAQATSGYQEHIINQDAAATSLRAEVRKLKQTDRQVVGGGRATRSDKRPGNEERNKEASPG